MSVPASPVAGSALRKAVRSLEVFFGPDKAEEVELLVTELATNGVKHAATTGVNRITLDASVGDEGLHVAVSDRGEGFTPVERSPVALRARRLGPDAGRRIADRWGVESEPTRVWFELAGDHETLAA